MEYITPYRIRAFLEAVGERYARPATLFLIGGSALALLGSPRLTLDVDYIGDDLKLDDLQKVVAQIADEMHVDVEPVPIAQFVPLPENAQDRCVFLAKFGTLTVYVFDPYTIALSKLDRGFDTDIEDVVFLINQGFVEFEQLETYVSITLERANEFDMDPAAVRMRLQVVRTLL